MMEIAAAISIVLSGKGFSPSAGAIPFYVILYCNVSYFVIDEPYRILYHMVGVSLISIVSVPPWAISLCMM